MPRAAELEIFVGFRKRIAVEHNGGLAATARYAPEHFMLAALAEFAEIGEGTVRRRHAGIVFLDPPAHFGNQLLLQVRGMAEQALGVVVFRFEIIADVRVQRSGIVQHFLPIGVLQPGVVVDHRDAVLCEGMRPARGDRCQRRFFQDFCHSILVRSGQYRPPTYGSGRADCHNPASCFSSGCRRWRRTSESG